MLPQAQALSRVCNDGKALAALKNAPSSLAHLSRPLCHEGQGNFRPSKHRSPPAKALLDHSECLLSTPKSSILLQYLPKHTVLPAPHTAGPSSHTLSQPSTPTGRSLPLTPSHECLSATFSRFPNHPQRSAPTDHILLMDKQRPQDWVPKPLSPACAWSLCWVGFLLPQRGLGLVARAGGTLQAHHQEVSS